MQVTDLLHALPGAVLLGVLPGFALASLVMPGWPAWWRLAGAPGLSAGMTGVIGLVFHQLHVGFGPLTVLPVEAGVAIAAVRATRRGPDRELRDRSAAGRWVVTAAIAAGLVTSVGVVIGYHDQALPVETDAPVHAAVARAIADSGDVIPVIPEPIDASGFVRPRMGVEAEVALISRVGGPGTAGSLLPLVLLSVALMPLGVALLCMRAIGSRAIALLAALFTVGWAFPSNAVTFGEFPYVVDATLVAPLIVACLDALQGRYTRRAVVMAALIVASIWVIHGLEALTAVCVGGPLLAAVLYRGGGPALRRAGAVGAAMALAALAVTVLSRAPHLANPTASPLQGPTITETSVFGSSIPHLGWADGLTYVRQFGFAGNAAIALAVLGCFAAVLGRRMRWAVVSLAAVVGIALDVVSGGHLKRLWLDVYPWSSGDRVLAMLFWVLPPLMAFGVVTVWRGLAARAGPPPDTAGVRRRRRLALGLVGAAVGLTGVVGLTRDLDIYAAAERDRGVVTADDVRVLAAADAALPSGVTVLTDGLDDSGQWLAAFAPGRALFTKPYVQDHPADLRVVALAGACQDPAAARAALQDVGAIFIGSTLRSDAGHPWRLDCIGRVPGVRVILSSGAPGRAAALLLVSHT